MANNNQRNNNNDKPQQTRKPIRPDEVLDFMDLNYSDYKKEFKKELGKKECKRRYLEEVVELVPYASNYVFNSGYIESEAEVGEHLQKMLLSEKTINAIIKECKNDDYYKDSLNTLPYFIRAMLIDMKEHQEQVQEEDEEALIAVREALIKLINIIFEKKLNKLEKKGVDKAIALDLLSILVKTGPDHDRIKFYQISEAFRTLYDYADKEPDLIAPGKPLDFIDLMSTIAGKDNIPMIIQFALNERNDKKTSMTDKQKAYWDHITQSIFSALEEYDKDEIDAILISYIDNRKRDYQNGKDSARRFHIVDLPESEFPKTIKRVRKLIADDESNKQYLS